MTGVALMKKRCRDDTTLNGNESILEAANALAGLSGDTSDCHCHSSDDEGRHEPATAIAPSGKETAKMETVLASKVSVSFPEKLMKILTTLESESFDSSHSNQPIAWLPSGDGFIISRPNEFTLEVLPRFFSQRTEFSSFTRKLYWWGFRKVSRGSGYDAFQHEYFRRSDPALCRKMKGRSRKKITMPKKSMSKEAIVKDKTISNDKKEASANTGNVVALLPQAASGSTVTPIMAESSFVSASSVTSSQAVAALPAHKALGLLNNSTGAGNQVQAAADMLLNNSSPLVAAAGLRLHQSAATNSALQQQTSQNQATTQATLQQLILQHSTATNQAIALALAAQQQQSQQQMLNNVAAHLARLQSLTTHTAVGASDISSNSTQSPNVQTAALTAPHTGQPSLTPTSQIVLHVHHHKTSDGKNFVTVSRGNAANGGSAQSA